MFLCSVFVVVNLALVHSIVLALHVSLNLVLCLSHSELDCDNGIKIVYGGGCVFYQSIRVG